MNQVFLLKVCFILIFFHKQEQRLPRCCIVQERNGNQRDHGGII